MNQRERDELLQFLEPLLRTRVIDKDLAAESLILQQCARQPDAMYLLVQRAMALEAALLETQKKAASDAPADSAGQLRGDTPGLATDGADRRDARPRRHGDGAWGRGLLTQAGAIGAGVGLGVAAGIVSGSLLLDAIEDGFTDGL